MLERDSIADSPFDKKAARLFIEQRLARRKSTSHAERSLWVWAPTTPTSLKLTTSII